MECADIRLADSTIQSVLEQKIARSHGPRLLARPSTNRSEGKLIWFDLITSIIYLRFNLSRSEVGNK